MSVQQTKRKIEELSGDMFPLVFNHLDCDFSIDTDTAAKCAQAAREAVYRTLRQELDCVGLNECFAQSGE